MRRVCRTATAKANAVVLTRKPDHLPACLYEFHKEREATHLETPMALQWGCLVFLSQGQFTAAFCSMERGALALVKVIRIPCFGRRMTIGRGSIVWPGTNSNSYRLISSLKIMRI